MGRMKNMDQVGCNLCSQFSPTITPLTTLLEMENVDFSVWGLLFSNNQHYLHPTYLTPADPTVIESGFAGINMTRIPK